MSRRTHPYFSQVDRRSQAAVSAQRQVNARAPLAKPKDEPGVLWDAFREPQPPA